VCEQTEVHRRLMFVDGLVVWSDVSTLRAT
jgi:hypothetical protein